MKKIGIIAEYNPFHNGHIYQINEIKKRFPDSLIIVVLNGNFTQKGDISVVNKWDKVKVLLNHDIDLVIELPTFFGINSSDIFSKGALEILNELKIDTLVFGTERENIDDIIDSVKIKNTKKFKDLLKSNLDKGYSFPKSYYDALKELTNIEIKTPNDILAFSYINEIYESAYKIKPINIKRTNDYNSTDLNGIASATAIRNAYKNNINIDNYIPSDIKEYINDISLNNYFDIIKYKIMVVDDLTIYHDVKEGIDVRLKEVINEVNNIDELIEKTKCKRFTYNRIKRILLYILLDIKKDIKVKNYIRILGMNKKGEEYLKSIKKELKIPMISNYSKNKTLLSYEYKFNSIYSLRMNNTNEYINRELNKPIRKED